MNHQRAHSATSQGVYLSGRRTPGGTSRARRLLATNTALLTFAAPMLSGPPFSAPYCTPPLLGPLPDATQNRKQRPASSSARHTCSLVHCPSLSQAAACPLARPWRISRGLLLPLATASSAPSNHHAHAAAPPAGRVTHTQPIFFSTLAARTPRDARTRLLIPPQTPTLQNRPRIRAHPGRPRRGTRRRRQTGRADGQAAQWTDATQRRRARHPLDHITPHHADALRLAMPSHHSLACRTCARRRDAEQAATPSSQRRRAASDAEQPATPSRQRPQPHSPTDRTAPRWLLRWMPPAHAHLALR